MNIPIAASIILSAFSFALSSWLLGRSQVRDKMQHKEALARAALQRGLRIPEDLTLNELTELAVSRMQTLEARLEDR